MRLLEPSHLAVVVLALVLAGNLGWALGARPQRGVLLLAALAPFDGLLLIAPAGDLLAPWKEGLTLLVLVATFLAPASARARAAQPVTGWVPAAVGLLVLGLASAVWSGNVVGLWGVKVSYFYLLLPVILWRCPFDRRERDRLVGILMVTGVVTALVGLVQQRLGPTRLHELGYGYNDVIRFSGSTLRSFSTFTQPFSFGLFLTLVLLVCLPVAMSDLRRPRSLAFLALTPVLVLGMATSVVRGAMLGLAAGLLLLAVWHYRGLFHAFVPVALSVVLVPTTLLTTFLSSSSLQERTTGWSEVFAQLLSAPLGHGLGTTGAAAQKAVEGGAPLSDVVTLGGRVYQPDNQFVKAAIELGPLGLWLLVLLFLAVIAAAVSVAGSSHGDDQAFARGVAASVVGVTVASLVSTYLEIFPLDVYFWMLVGVLWSNDRSSTSTRSAFAPVAAGSRPTSES